MSEQHIELSKLAIRGVIDSYSNAVSRRDWALLSSLFAEDAIWSTRGTGTDRDIDGRDKIVETISGALKALPVLLSMPSGHFIEVDGDRAKASTVMMERVVIDKDRGKVQYGIYHDTLARTGGTWKFQTRVFHTIHVDES